MFDCDDYLSSGSDESLPLSPIYDRYQSGNGYHAVPPPYTGTFMPPKPDLVFNNVPNYVVTDHPAFTVKLGPNKPDQTLSHTNRPLAPFIEDWVSNSEDESETKIPHNVPSFVQSIEQVKAPRLSVQHVETFIPTATPKPASLKPTSFVCKSLDHLIKDYDYHEKKMAQPTARNHAQRGNHNHYARMSLPNPQRHVVPAAVLTQSKPVPITADRLVTTAVPKTSVTRPRQAKTVVTKSKSPPRRHINHRPSPKASTFPLKVTAVKAPMGNLQHALKDKGVIDSGCLRHMTGNTSYLSDFKELNGVYVAFGGNPKGGKISKKGKIRIVKLDFNDVYFVKEFKFNIFSVLQMCDKKNSVLFTDTECLVLYPEFKLPDENQVLLRIPRETNMYNGIKREFSVPRTPQQNGIVERKNRTLIEAARTMLADLLLPIPFWAETVNTACYVQNRVLVTKPQNKTPYELLHGEEIVQQYVLYSVWSLGSTNPQNTDGDAAFDEKEPDFEGSKPESEVNVSPSSSGYRNLSIEFEDFSVNIINEDNAAGTLVYAIGQLSPNSTNPFSAAGPLNAAASLTRRKSSCIDTSQLLDDPNMPELED
nr:ribonuclease H-like domain-containing protein [Tanacetum cinerariifolium]